MDKTSAKISSNPTQYNPAHVPEPLQHNIRLSSSCSSLSACWQKANLPCCLSNNGVASVLSGFRNELQLSLAWGHHHQEIYWGQASMVLPVLEERGPAECQQHGWGHSWQFCPACPCASTAVLCSSHNPRASELRHSAHTVSSPLPGCCREQPSRGARLS